jgi:hypothetical protein
LGDYSGDNKIRINASAKLNKEVTSYVVYCGDIQTPCSCDSSKSLSHTFEINENITSIKDVVLKFSATDPFSGHTTSTKTTIYFKNPTYYGAYAGEINIDTISDRILGINTSATNWYGDKSITIDGTTVSKRLVILAPKTTGINNVKGNGFNVVLDSYENEDTPYKLWYSDETNRKVHYTFTLIEN